MTDKIKIIHVLQSLEVGGLENGVVNLANSIDKTRFDIVLCCLRREGALRERLDKSIRVKCLHEKDGFNPARLFKLARFFYNEKPHIVHMHGWGSDLFSGVLGARLARVPVLLNGEHGVLHLDRKRRVIAHKLLFKLINYVIPVSHSLKKEIIEKLKVPANKIIPIINGVDIDKFKPDPAQGATLRRELGFRVDDIIIGSVGRLELVKDYVTLIQAACEVMKSELSAQLLFVGDGSQRNALMVLSKSLGIEGRTHFIGSRSDIPAVMNAIDIFVLTSVREGASNTILEAMSCGKTVIATSVGDDSYLVKDGETGYLVRVGGIEEISKKIKVLLCDKAKRDTLGNSGRERAAKGFSLDGMVSSYQTLYSEAIAGS